MFTEQKFRVAKLGEENYSPTEIIKKLSDEIVPGVTRTITFEAKSKGRTFGQHFSTLGNGHSRKMPEIYKPYFKGIACSS